MTARVISELYYKYIYIYIFIYICSQRTSKRKYAASLVTMDYGSPSKPTDHKLPKRLFYPNTQYSTSTARPSRPPTPHTKKHATNVDTGILYTTNHPQLTNRKTGNGTTYSGTTLHSAKTSAPLSDTDKHFPKDHKLRKNFNRNTIKISFSSMNNTKQIIYNHNKRILCPSEHIDSTADDTAINIKTIYRNHTASFRHAKHRNSTELSKNIWTLKDNNISYFIS